jgi:hypothetical protein
MDENACTWWVAGNGGDGNLGTRSQPWATLQHAADEIEAGDVVCVAAGTYPVDTEVKLTTSGTAAAPITFTTLGEDVTLRGGFSLARKVSHFRLHGFTITGFDDWGVTVHGDSEDVVLSGLTISGGEAGIRLTVGRSGTIPEHGPVADVTIEDSVIRGSTYTAVDCTPGPCDDLTLRRLEVHGAGAGGNSGYAGDGIAVEKGSNVVVEDCYVHDNLGDGIDLNSRDLGKDMPGIVVRRNRVVGNGLHSVKLWAGGLVADNLIANGGSTALVLRGGTYHILDNTLAGISSHAYMAVLGDYDNEHPATVHLSDNIFYNDDANMAGTLVFFPRTVTLHADRNTYYNPYREEDVICAEFLAQDPCFGKEEINDGTWHARSRQGKNSRYAHPGSSFRDLDVSRPPG